MTVPFPILNFLWRLFLFQLRDLVPLGSLPHVSVLSVAGNPCSSLPLTHARSFIVFAIPSLHSLDDKEITKEERQEALVRFERGQSKKHHEKAKNKEERMEAEQRKKTRDNTKRAHRDGIRGSELKRMGRKRAKKKRREAREQKGKRKVWQASREQNEKTP